jgi:peptidoglycan/LPS O-acetylase OafA/YrhL
MSSDKRRIVFLDLCRILAVVSVFIGHKFYADLNRISASTSNHIIFRDIIDFIKPFCYGGGFGAVLFFCVSGYIIRYVLETENLLDFSIKRIFRIYPLYWTAVLIWYFLTPVASRPTLNTLLIQLSLFGDFFNAPCALNGVEWTLRIEVLFYMLLGIAKATGLLKLKSIGLIIVLFSFSLLLFIMPAWPPDKIWSQGYVSIYSPFLFIGVYFREFEKRNIAMPLLFTLIGSTIFMYCLSIQSVQPNWINAKFSVLGVLVFSLLYWKRLKITLPAWAIILSELTYGLYLFHNWLFEHFSKTLPKSDFPRIFSLIALTLFCYAMHRFIEKPGILIGRAFISRLNKNPSNIN